MNYPECMGSGRDYARNDEHLRRNDVGVFREGCDSEESTTSAVAMAHWEPPACKPHARRVAENLPDGCDLYAEPSSDGTRDHSVVQGLMVDAWPGATLCLGAGRYMLDLEVTLAQHDVGSWRV